MSKSRLSWFGPDVVLFALGAVVFGLAADIVSISDRTGPSHPLYAASQDVAVSTGSDDAEEAGPEFDLAAMIEVAGGDPGGEVDSGSSDLELTYDGSFQTIGVRFNGIDIPPGSQITKAYIQFVCDEVRDPYPTELTIKAEAADNAATFVERDHNISSRPTTKASVPWAPKQWTEVGQAGPLQRTPDLKALVKEVVHRPGWAAGNSMAFILSGRGRRVAGAENGKMPAVLHLEWQVREYGVQFSHPALDGTEDNETANLEVQLTKKARIPISVDYEVLDLTTNRADYLATRTKGTLTFKPGTTKQALEIKIVDDRKPEPAEQFKVVLSNVVGGDLDAGLDGNEELTYTILDSSPRIAFAQPESMSDESVGSVALDVALTKPWDKDVTVAYKFLPSGTSAAADDYKVLGSGRLTYKPGETSKRIGIEVVDDQEDERAEQVTIALSDPVEALLGSQTRHLYRIAASDTGTDWPMWRGGPGRTGATPRPLPADLKLSWVLASAIGSRLAVR